MGVTRTSLYLLVSAVIAVKGLHVQIRGGSNLQLTDSLRSYAERKIQKPIARHADLLQGDNVELHLKVQSRSRHDTEHLGKESHIAEVTAHCIDKVVIHCAATSEDMYASLDDLADTLSRKLRKYKERRNDLKQTRRREGKVGYEDTWNLADTDDDDVSADLDE